jgi:hypothetical protein
VLLISLAQGIHAVRADSNDYISFSSGITLYSPINTTYNSRSLTLNLTLYGAGSMGSIDNRVSLTYSIDGIYNGSVNLVVSNPGVHLITNGTAVLSLPELSEGSHCLTLYLYGYNQRTYEPQFLSYTNYVCFTIDLTPRDLTPPSILVLSPENKTYNTADIPLNFTINEETTNITPTV